MFHCHDFLDLSSHAHIVSFVITSGLWSRGRKEILGAIGVGAGVGKKCTDSEPDLSLKS
jgi:hypothetical protein